MTPSEYIQNALRTFAMTESGGISFASAEPDKTSEFLMFDANLQHVAEGLVTESAELLDALKKYKFYRKPLDVVNLKEEMGDLLYYLAIGCHVLNTTFEQLMAQNISKLKARYPEGFSEEHANNRDLETERKILEE